VKQVSSFAPGATGRSRTAIDVAIPLMTVREVADFLGVHEKTVLRLVAKGRLPCVRVGRSVRYIPSDISRWVSARKGE
jgi:excisionase family DNA binding protein